MAAQNHSDELVQLRSELMAQRAEVIAQQMQLATQQARLAQLERCKRVPRRFFPLALVALLVALVPLGVLAANPFTDLDPAQAGPTGHNSNIDLLYNAGITTGCTPTEYCPKDAVTREQMATFLARTAGLGSNAPVVNAKTVAGYVPSDLIRAARAGTVPSGFLTTITGATTPDAYQNALTLTITAPTAGFVVLNGAIMVESNAACTGFDCSVFARLRHSNSDARSPHQIASVDFANNRDAVISLAYGFPVEPGVQTFTLQVAKGTAAMPAKRYASPQMNALFTPFGSTGTSAFGTDEPVAPHDGEKGGGQP